MYVLGLSDYLNSIHYCDSFETIHEQVSRPPDHLNNKFLQNFIENVPIIL